MVPISPTAQVVARRLLAPARSPSAPGLTEGEAEQQASAAERVCRNVADALSRTLGPYGYHALLTRALSQTRDHHAPLAEVRISSPLEPYLEGLSAAAQAHGTDATVDSVVAVLAALIDLLGRLIGEDLAITLVTQSVPLASGNEPAGGAGMDTPRDPGTAA